MTGFVAKTVVVYILFCQLLVLERVENVACRTGIVWHTQTNTAIVLYMRYILG